jgi:hypothetical protein
MISSKSIVLLSTATLVTLIVGALYYLYLTYLLPTQVSEISPEQTSTEQASTTEQVVTTRLEGLTPANRTEEEIAATRERLEIILVSDERSLEEIAATRARLEAAMQ